VNALTSPILHIAMILIGVGLLGIGVAGMAHMTERFFLRWDRRKKSSVHKIGEVFWDDDADRMVIKAASKKKQALLDARTRGREPYYTGEPVPMFPLQEIDVGDTTDVDKEIDVDKTPVRKYRP
jgi:hypothetical protein